MRYNRGHMKLAHALIAKSIAESILVGVLAVTFYISAFPPTYHGWGEVLPDGIAGWAVNHASPWERVEVQLFIDAKFVATATANLNRPDIVAAGWARDAWHGYKFDGLKVRGPGRHQAIVYVLHSTRSGSQQTLQRLGDPIWFNVDDSGMLEPIYTRRFVAR